MSFLFNTMKHTKLIMGMPITVEISQEQGAPEAFDKVFDYFESVDRKFSTYKKDSEISKINRGEIPLSHASAEMQKIFQLAEQTKQQTSGYFDIKQPDGKYDPSGLVKGWAIHEASLLLEKLGFKRFFVEAGGDIQACSKNDGNIEKWSVGIRNPFNREEIVKVVYLESEGMATSGTYIRGQHIYNPHKPGEKFTEIVSLTVIGPNIYEADRFATAAFAMGKEGINFIEGLQGFEGYSIDSKGIATMTGGLGKYLEN